MKLQTQNQIVARGSAAAARRPVPTRLVTDSATRGRQLRTTLPAMHVQTRFAVARPAVVALLCLLAAVTAAQAQWAWRDKSGQVTASDRPPPKDIPDKDIIRRPAERRSAAPNAAAVAAATAAASAAASAPAAAPGPKTALEAQVEACKKAAEQEQAAKAKAEEEKLATQRADNCRAARSHLAALEGGQRIARTNDKGEREVLDDKGRAEESRRAREVLTSDCR